MLLFFVFPEITPFSTDREGRFRKMILKLSQNLTLSNCRMIASLNLHSVAAKSFLAGEDLDAALYVLSSLEANGSISHWRMDDLESILCNIDRYDLVSIVTGYKQKEGTYVYMLVICINSLLAIPLT